VSWLLRKRAKGGREEEGRRTVVRGRSSSSSDWPPPNLERSILRPKPVDISKSAEKDGARRGRMEVDGKEGTCVRRRKDPAGHVSCSVFSWSRCYV
jgi:hypothetical protein